MSRVALHHLVGGLEAGVGDLSNGQLLMVSLLRGDDGGVGDQREVDPGVGHQVGLEFSQVHVEGSIKAQGGGDGGHDLANYPIEVGVGRSTLRAPSNLREAVMEDTIWPIILLGLE